MGGTLSLDQDAKETAVSEDNNNNTNQVFPKWGLRLSHLLEFYQACGGREKLQGLSSRDVLDKFILPWSLPQQESFCDYLQRHQHTAVAPQANVFICHAWQEDFLQVMDAVERHLKQAQDNTTKSNNSTEPIVWLSLFSCNPHKPNVLDKEWFGSFRLAVAEMGRMVLVRGSTLSNDPMTRTWCLLELYYAATSQPPCSLEIAMSSTEQQEVLDEIHKNPESAMNEVHAIIDVEQSQCSVKEDKENILRLIKDTVGYATVNAKVLDQYLTLMIRIAKQALQVESASSADIVDQLVRLNTVGELYQTQDNHFMAEYYFGKAMEKTYLYHQLLPPDQQQRHAEESLKIMHNFAKLYYKEEHYAEAKELVADCLARRTQVLGLSHPDTLSTINLQANILNGMGEHAAATTLYQDCLARRKAQLGEDHQDTLVSMHNLGAIWLDHHHYDKAQPVLKECMEKQLKLLGRNHPHTQCTMGNLINTYERKANTSNMLALSPKIC